MNGSLAAGIHKLTDAEYHSDPSGQPSLSSTIARKLIFQSPLHAWTAHPRLNPHYEPVEKKTFDVGRAAHRAFLGAGGDYVAIPADLLASNGAASTKAAKDFIADARESGKTPLKQEEVDAIEEMAGKAHDRLDQMRIWLDSDRSELVALGEIDGAACRIMVDNAPDDPRAPFYDFKTTTDANPDHCVKAVMNFGYDVQAAFYQEVWKAATGEERPFRFVFQEKDPPFEVSVVELSPGDLAMARKKTRRAREIWRNCLASNHWPGYPAGVHRVELSPWFHERWLERESAEADHKARTGRDILDQARRWQAPAAAE